MGIAGSWRNLGYSVGERSVFFERFPSCWISVADSVDQEAFFFLLFFKPAVRKHQLSYSKLSTMEIP